MNDTLLERIKAVQIGVDAQYIEAMQDRILADAAIIKAAQHLERIASAVWLTMDKTDLADELLHASDAFRTAMEERG